MNRLTATFALVLAISLCAAALATSWKPVAPHKSGARFEMPTNPEILKVNSGENSRRHLWSRTNQHIFGFSWSDFDSSELANNGATDAFAAEPVLMDVIEELLGEGMTIVREEAKTVQGFPGRTAAVKDAEGRDYRFFAVIANGKLYILWAQHRTGSLDPSMVDRFFRSLKIEG